MSSELETFKTDAGVMKAMVDSMVALVITKSRKANDANDRAIEAEESQRKAEEKLKDITLRLNESRGMRTNMQFKLEDADKDVEELKVSQKKDREKIRAYKLQVEELLGYKNKFASVKLDYEELHKRFKKLRGQELEIDPEVGP